MGQAKQRGTYQQRLAEAKVKQNEISKHRARRPRLRAKPNKWASIALVIAALSEHECIEIDYKPCKTEEEI